MDAPWNEAVYWAGHSRLEGICQFAHFLSTRPQLSATLRVDDMRLCS